MKITTDLVPITYDSNEQLIDWSLSIFIKIDPRRFEDCVQKKAWGYNK